MTTTQSGSRSPEPLGFLNIDALLADEELATREEIRSLVWERIKPNIREWWQKAIFPRGIVPEMGLWACSACTSKATAMPAGAP